MEQSFINKSWKQNSDKTNNKNFGPKRNNFKNRGYNNPNNKYQRRSFSAAVPEESTPWSKLRDELFEKQQFDKGEELSDSETKKKFMQEKEENHRKFMIEAKQKEDVKWEDFSNNVELAGAATNAFRRAPITLPKIGKNFDNRNLTAVQQTHIKKEITKCAFKKAGKTKNLQQALVDLKRYGPIQNKKFK